MKLTDRKRIYHSLWAALALLLSACASGPGERAPTTDEGAFNAVLPSVEPSRPNPYLHGSRARASDAERQTFARAQQAMRDGDWPGARTALENLTQSSPELSGPWLNLGIVWQKLGQPDRARAALEEAIAANPDNLDAYNHLGVLLREAGEFERAREVYQRALGVWPWHLDTHRNLGILYDIYLGDGARALPHYEAAQALSTESSAELNGWIIDLKRRLDAGEGQP